MVHDFVSALCMHHWVQRATRNAAGKCIAWVSLSFWMPIWVPLLQPRCIICNFYQGHQPCDPIRFPAQHLRRRALVASPTRRARLFLSLWALWGFILAHTHSYIPIHDTYSWGFEHTASIIYWLSKQNNILSVGERFSSDAGCSVGSSSASKKW